VIADAEGEASRFEAILTEYKRAPQVTRSRLYLQAVEEVYANSKKVLIDSKSNNLIYLPLDKLVGGETRSSTDEDASRASDAQSTGAPAGSQAEIDEDRDRRTRQ
jgi:membrane protease subunit HflK